MAVTANNKVAQTTNDLTKEEKTLKDSIFNTHLRKLVNFIENPFGKALDNISAIDKENVDYSKVNVVPKIYLAEIINPKNLIKAKISKISKNHYKIHTFDKRNEQDIAETVVSNGDEFRIENIRCKILDGIFTVVSGCSDCDLELNSEVDINIVNLLLKGDLVLKTSRFVKIINTLEVDGFISIYAKKLSNDYGELFSTQTIKLNIEELDNERGRINSYKLIGNIIKTNNKMGLIVVKNLDVNGNELINFKGKLTGEEINFILEKSTDNRYGVIYAYNYLNLSCNRTIKNKECGIIGSNKNLKVRAKVIKNDEGSLIGGIEKVINLLVVESQKTINQSVIRAKKVIFEPFSLVVNLKASEKEDNKPFKFTHKSKYWDLGNVASNELIVSESGELDFKKLKVKDMLEIVANDYIYLKENNNIDVDAAVKLKSDIAYIDSTINSKNKITVDAREVLLKKKIKAQIVKFLGLNSINSEDRAIEACDLIMELAGENQITFENDISGKLIIKKIISGDIKISKSQKSRFMSLVVIDGDLIVEPEEKIKEFVHLLVDSKDLNEESIDSNVFEASANNVIFKNSGLRAKGKSKLSTKQDVRLGEKDDNIHGAYLSIAGEFEIDAGNNVYLRYGFFDFQKNIIARGVLAEFLSAMTYVVGDAVFDFEFQKQSLDYFKGGKESQILLPMPKSKKWHTNAEQVENRIKVLSSPSLLVVSKVIHNHRPWEIFGSFVASEDFKGSLPKINSIGDFLKKRRVTLKGHKKPGNCPYESWSEYDYGNAYIGTLIIDSPLDSSQEQFHSNGLLKVNGGTIKVENFNDKSFMPEADITKAKTNELLGIDYWINLPFLERNSLDYGPLLLSKWDVVKEEMKISNEESFMVINEGIKISTDYRHLFNKEIESKIILENYIKSNYGDDKYSEPLALYNDLINNNLEFNKLTDAKGIENALKEYINALLVYELINIDGNNVVIPTLLYPEGYMKKYSQDFMAKIDSVGNLNFIVKSGELTGKVRVKGCLSLEILNSFNITRAKVVDKKVLEIYKKKKLFKVFGKKKTSSIQVEDVNYLQGGILEAQSANINGGTFESKGASFDIENEITVDVEKRIDDCLVKVVNDKNDHMARSFFITKHDSSCDVKQEIVCTRYTVGAGINEKAISSKYKSTQMQAKYIYVYGRDEIIIDAAKNTIESREYSKRKLRIKTTKSYNQDVVMAKFTALLGDVTFRSKGLIDATALKVVGANIFMIAKDVLLSPAFNYFSSESKTSGIKGFKAIGNNERMTQQRVVKPLLIAFSDKIILKAEQNLNLLSPLLMACSGEIELDGENVQVDNLCDFVKYYSSQNSLASEHILFDFLDSTFRNDFKNASYKLLDAFPIIKSIEEGIKSNDFAGFSSSAIESIYLTYKALREMGDLNLDSFKDYAVGGFKNAILKSPKARFSRQNIANELVKMSAAWLQAKDIIVRAEKIISLKGIDGTASVLDIQANDQININAGCDSKAKSIRQRSVGVGFSKGAITGDVTMKNLDERATNFVNGFLEGLEKTYIKSEKVDIKGIVLKTKEMFAKGKIIKIQTLQDEYKIKEKSCSLSSEGGFAASLSHGNKKWSKQAGLNIERGILDFDEVVNVGGVVGKMEQGTENILTKITENGLEFYELEIPRDGDCGFHCLGVSRQNAVSQLLERKDDLEIRKLLAFEIKNELIAFELPSSLDENSKIQGLGLAENYSSLLTELEKLKNILHDNSDDRVQVAEDFNEREQLILQKLSVLDEVISDFCQREDVFSAYIKEVYEIKREFLRFMTTGTSSIDAIAKINNLKVTIWQENNQGVLSKLYTTKDEAFDLKEIDMLFKQGEQHFNLLSKEEVILKADRIHYSNVDDFDKLYSYGIGSSSQHVTPEANIKREYKVNQATISDGITIQTASDISSLNRDSSLSEKHNEDSEHSKVYIAREFLAKESEFDKYIRLKKNDEKELKSKMDEYLFNTSILSEEANECSEQNENKEELLRNEGECKENDNESLKSSLDYDWLEQFNKSLKLAASNDEGVFKKAIESKANVQERAKELDNSKARERNVKHKNVKQPNDSFGDKKTPSPILNQEGKSDDWLPLKSVRKTALRKSEYKVKKSKNLVKNIVSQIGESSKDKQMSLDVGHISIPSQVLFNRYKDFTSRKYFSNNIISAGIRGYEYLGFDLQHDGNLKKEEILNATFDLNGQTGINLSSLRMDIDNCTLDVDIDGPSANFSVGGSFKIKKNKIEKINAQVNASVVAATIKTSSKFKKVYCSEKKCLNVTMEADWGLGVGITLGAGFEESSKSKKLYTKAGGYKGFGGAVSLGFELTKKDNLDKLDKPRIEKPNAKILNKLSADDSSVAKNSKCHLDEKELNSQNNIGYTQSKEGFLLFSKKNYEPSKSNFYPKKASNDSGNVNSLSDFKNVSPLNIKAITMLVASSEASVKKLFKNLDSRNPFTKDLSQKLAVKINKLCDKQFQKRLKIFYPVIKKIVDNKDLTNSDLDMIKKGVEYLGLSLGMRVDGKSDKAKYVKK